MKPSKRTILRITTGAFGRRYHLEHISAGVEAAGSGTRIQEHEAWAVACFDRDGTRHSTRYAVEAEAIEHFERFTTPIEAIDA